MITYYVKYQLLLCLMLCCNALSAQQTYFKHDFAPSANFIRPDEKPFRESLCLNGIWKFAPFKGGSPSHDQIFHPMFPTAADWEQVPLKVPSPWNVNSFARGDGSGGDFVTYPSYPKSWEQVKAGWLMHRFSYQKEWKNKRLILRFDAIAGYTQVFINGHKAGENMEIFLPFEVDITNEVKTGGENEILVWVADAQLTNEPGPYGRRTYVAGSFWGQHIIGPWQDVNLLVKPAVQIQNVFVNPSVHTGELLVDATLTNTVDVAQTIKLSGHINPWINLADTGNVITAPEPRWKSGPVKLSIPERSVQLSPGSSQTVHLRIKVAGQLQKWTPDNPHLYGLTLGLSKSGRSADASYTRFGWREFRIDGNKFYLNDKPIVLNGDSWHFMGIPQMTRRYAWAWFTALRRNHVNAVRLHAQPYPEFYLDMADEMGICVLDETGMWASDGGPKINSETYWKNSEAHLRMFILRDRNHPSVFGWSVCNENMPVAINVFHAPDSLVRKQEAEINKWIRITAVMDPSRQWISGDGETQADLNAPTIIGHYGGTDENYRTLAAKGKVWGIGEAGMAYFATPLQSAVYNGNRSFVSQEGRMEGVAEEATGLINLFKKYNATYRSVFNLVWYALQPLELGMHDTSRPPMAADGIFFGPYRENEPGVQPERLGPYTTTLNPGYDPALPMYRSWPLLDAARASFAKPLPVPEKQKVVRPAGVENNHSKVEVRLLSADKDSSLQRLLRGLGVLLHKDIAPSAAGLLVIDGSYPPADEASLEAEHRILKNGGKVWVWGVSPASLSTLNRYLDKPLALTNRTASSFITGAADAAMANLDNQDFYFSELSNNAVSSYGLDGAVTNGAKILLSDCNTDWRKWNKRAEYLKTAAVLRSEREWKPAGNALITINQGGGQVYIFSISPSALYNVAPIVTRKLLANLGANFSDRSGFDFPAITADGTLQQSLILGTFSAAELDKLNLQAQKDQDFVPGKEVNGRFWEPTMAKNGKLSLTDANLNGASSTGFAYLSFWLYSPRSLSNLLLEPDMPQLDMLINGGDGHQVFMNGKLLSQADKDLIKALPMEKGWNHFLIRVNHQAGNSNFSVAFHSDKPEFLKEMKSRIAYQ